MQKALYIFGIIAVLLAAIFLFFKSDVFQKPAYAGPHLVVSPLEYDFGKLLQSQPIVSAYFDVLNNGSQDAIISGTPTSCGCASAEISQNIIKPNETAKLKVSFDPNFHEEPEGKFFRTATIKYNSADSPEVKVWMEVEYDLGKDKLKFGKDLD